MGFGVTKPSGRSLKQRVKTGKGRTLSSKMWLERQLNDPYVQRAKREGYRSRAAFKLVEIDDKYRILKKGRACRSISAPRPAAGARWRPNGSARAAGSSPSTCSTSSRSPGVDFIQLDFLDPAAPDELKARLGGEADVVLTDMAANATGHRKTDHIKIVALVEAAAEFAREVLKPGGAFLAKVIQGGTEPALLAQLKKRFRHRATRQAGGEPRGLRRALSARDRFSQELAGAAAAEDVGETRRLNGTDLPGRLALFDTRRRAFLLSGLRGGLRRDLALILAAG